MKTKRKIFALAMMLALLTSSIGASGVLALQNPVEAQPVEWEASGIHYLAMEPEVVYATTFWSEVSDYMDVEITPLAGDLTAESALACSGSHNVSLTMIFTGTTITVSYDTQIAYGKDINNCYYSGTLYMTDTDAPYYNNGVWNIPVYFAGTINHAYCLAK